TNKTVSCGTAWNFDPPLATNFCNASNLTVTLLNTTTNGSPCSTILTRAWSSTDQAGYSNTCSQSVTVADTAPPVLTCASNKTVNCGSPWSFDARIAFDVCCGSNVSVTILNTLTNGGPCATMLTRTWQATDCCSNSATCSQVVTLLDTNLPYIIQQPQ